MCELVNVVVIDHFCRFYRFLADRFVEGTCPFCNYEVSLTIIICAKHEDLAVFDFLDSLSSPMTVWIVTHYFIF